jgi:Ca2+-binding RTX toxin-like protein
MRRFSISPHPCTAVLLLVLALCALTATASAQRKASHAGWPAIDGMLLMNKTDGSRPLDARPGHDPFNGMDSSYRCDADHRNQACFVRAGACRPSARTSWLCATVPLVPMASTKHNELLGGHGSDTIYAGPNGDVIWGDYKASGQPGTQTDTIYGGPGKDFIYASHGRNVIHTGGGPDVVHAHFGRGVIYCDSPGVTTYFSHSSRGRYRLHGCQHISFRAAGTQPA